MPEEPEKIIIIKNTPRKRGKIMKKTRINCMKCGKEIKLNFMDVRAVCKHCR
ncbi:MAG: hypothetical protein ACXAB8_18215 [Promethearchaeota archaeon]|jgi:hypothetical protein